MHTRARSPFTGYGAESGMGDKVYRGDRNGVRTPMQWSSDRNAGFSTAAEGKLYLPVIADPVYGYQAVNVAAQARQRASLLSTMRRLIAARRTSPVFRRGTIAFLRPRNQKVLAYLRRHGREPVLIVANLSGAPQPAELDLAEFAGVRPIELLGDTVFPRSRRPPKS